MRLRAPLLEEGWTPRPIGSPAARDSRWWCVTLTAVRGAALGGSAELATFCDVVVAADNATLGQPEIKVGVFPPIAALH